jgi:putative chitinase
MGDESEDLHDCSENDRLSERSQACTRRARTDRIGIRQGQALGFPLGNLPPASGMPAITVSIASKMFPSTPRDPIKTNLPHVLTALAANGLTSQGLVLTALATIRADTEGFVPISEYITRYNTSSGGHSFDLYDNRKDLGNQGPPDGADFKARGYVQITGRVNYAKFGPIIGIDHLTSNPDQANDSGIAAKLLAAFIASKQTAVSMALAANDLVSARR